MSSQEKNIPKAVGSMLLLLSSPLLMLQPTQLLTRQAMAAGTVLTDLQCDQYSDHYGDGSVSPLLVKTCCDPIFSNAQPPLKQTLIVGSQMYVAAARGKMICVDLFNLPDTAPSPAPSASPTPAASGSPIPSTTPTPTFVSRNLLTGLKTGLRGVTSLNFGPNNGMIQNRPALVAVDSDGSTEQVLVFNYLYDGNVPSDRRMRPAGLSLDVSSTVDSNRSELILLGQDGSVRTLSLRSTDYSLNASDHSRILAEIDPVGSYGNPIALAYSAKLDHIFVLTDSSQVLVFNRSQPGRVAPETTLSVADVEQPTNLVEEEGPNQAPTLNVTGANGSSASFALSAPSTGTNPPVAAPTTGMTP